LQCLHWQILPHCSNFRRARDGGIQGENREPERDEDPWRGMRIQGKECRSREREDKLVAARILIDTCCK
jgi:hypothetical protein